MMAFKEMLAQVITWLQQDQRVSYGALKRQFALDDAALADLQEALLYTYPHVQDDAGRGTRKPAPPRQSTQARCPPRTPPGRAGKNFREEAQASSSLELVRGPHTGPPWKRQAPATGDAPEQATDNLNVTSSAIEALQRG